MTCPCASTANSSVTFTLSPSAMSRRSAMQPSGVPGTLIMTFGRCTVAQRRCASAMVASASCAAPGDTSIETKPSCRFEDR